MTEVEIYLNVDTKNRFTETEESEREFALWYWSDKTGEAAAEEAFHISNAPDELLTDKQKISDNAGKVVHYPLVMLSV